MTPRALGTAGSMRWNRPATLTYGRVFMRRIRFGESSTQET